MDSIVRKFKTKLSKDDAAPKETVGTFDFSGVTEEQKNEVMMRGLVIMAQAQYRKAQHVPATEKIMVAELLKRQPGGFTVTPESIANRAGKDETFYRNTLVALGIDAKQIDKLVAAKFANK